VSKLFTTLLGFGTSVMSSLYGYFIVAGLGAVASMFITWHLVHINNAVEIADLKTQIATTRAVSTAASLEQLQSFIDNMHNASVDFEAYRRALDQKFDALQVEFKNAIRKPLPPDCKPTADRVRSFHNAINNANTH